MPKAVLCKEINKPIKTFTNSSRHINSLLPTQKISYS